MRINTIKTLIAALAVMCLATAASADIKIKSRHTFGGQPGQASESTTYIKGKRQRTEGVGGVASVMQCDLRRSLQLNGATRTYTVSPWEDAEAGAAPAAIAEAGAPAPARRGGVVTTTMTSTDTGERKQMFGYTARRIKTSMVTQSSPDACQATKSRMDSDGWYIDFAVEFDCYDRAGRAYGQTGRGGGCRDEYRTKQVGAAKVGYPVQVTMTMYDEAGSPSYTMTQEVLEISKATLDAALFDAPADYREVKDASEMYSARAAAAAAEPNDDEDAGSSNATNGANNIGANATRTDAPGAAAAVGPKRPGVVRLGVAMTRATAAEGMDPNALAEAVRNTLVNYLRGPAVEVVALEARLPAHIESEATQKECDYVVYTIAAHKKGGGGGFGGFLKKAAPAMNVIPAAGMAGGADGAVAASVASTMVYTAAGVAGSVKAKDELTLEYTVQKSGAAVVSNKLKAKAKTDGEDLITNLVEQIATAALAQAARQ